MELIYSSSVPFIKKWERHLYYSLDETVVLLFLVYYVIAVITQMCTCSLHIFVPQVTDFYYCVSDLFFFGGGFVSLIWCQI